MAYAGTISVEDATFEALLSDICQLQGARLSTSCSWAIAAAIRPAWRKSPMPEPEVVG
jgi:hypothetical protein